MRELMLAFSLLMVPALVSAQDHGDGHEVASAEELGGGQEHGGGHGPVSLSELFTSPQFLGAVVNFLVLVGLFVYFGRKPIGNFLAGRRKAVEEGLADAKRLTEAAEAKYKEYSERLEQLDRELENIRAEMVKAGEAERDRIVAEAEAKAARLRRETDFLIEQQMKQLRVDLTKETVEAAVSAAESVLREHTNAADQERLAKSYLERLQQEAREKEQRA
jgi:F-type H+-transporting ATPase subunit b